MAEAGTIFKQAIAAREDERAQEALLQRTMYTQMQQNVRDQKTRDFTRLTKVTDSIVTAMDNAATPGMKTILRKRFSGLIASVGRQDPMIGQALAARYPLDIRRMRIDEFMSRTPPPGRHLGEGETVDTNPSAAAQDYVNGLKYQRLLAKTIDGQDMDIKGFKQISKDVAVVIDDNEGKFHLESMEILNADPKLKEIAESLNISVVALLARGGDYGEAAVVVPGSDAEGNPTSTLVQTTKNALSGQMRAEVIYSHQKPSGPPKTTEAPAPDQAVREFIGLLAGNQRPSKPDQRLLYDDIKDMGEEYFELWNSQKDNASKQRVMKAYERQIEAKLQTLAPEHVFVLKKGIGPKVDTEGSAWWKKFKIGNTATIKPIYGKREWAQTADGKPFGLILDRANNLAYFSDGTLIPRGANGDAIANALAIAGSRTMAEWQAWAKGTE